MLKMVAILQKMRMEKVTMSADLMNEARSGRDAAELHGSFNELYVDSPETVHNTFLKVFLRKATEHIHTELVNLPRLDLDYSGDSILRLLSTAVRAKNRQFVELLLRLNASMNLLKAHQLCLPGSSSEINGGMSNIEYACVLTRLEILKLFVS